MLFFCKECDPNALSPIEGHKNCPDCAESLYYRCPQTKRDGLYRCYFRHARGCPTCPISDRQRNKKKNQTLRDREAALEKELREQEPAASWTQDEETMRLETGVSLKTFDLVQRSTSGPLKAVHSGKHHRKGHLLLSVSTLLLDPVHRAKIT